MRTAPETRPRMISEQISGANVRIIQGEFGQGVQFDLYDVDTRSAAPGLYAYHEGDLFTPGSQNFVFEPLFELPLVTIWGNAFLRRPNVFNPIQPPQVWSHPTVCQSGIGGLQAGTIDLEPLLSEGV